MKERLSWVVGRGGLLGRHVEASLSDGDELWVPDEVRWESSDDATAVLSSELRAFLDHAREDTRPWRILWCAGAGVVATPAEALAQETQLVSRFLANLEELLRRDGSHAQRGILFFASSAGGVYAGSEAPPPFDEDSPTGALAPYGREKLAQEALFRSTTAACGTDLLIGRFSNLYGPGQDLSKPQGLIAHVGRAALLREPVSIYVPLDTIRDYLFAADAGHMVAAALALRAHARRLGETSGPLTKIFASEAEVTVASVLAAWRQALRRPPRVAFAASPIAQLQPRTLSFRSRIWPELRGRPTPLLLGIETLRRDQLARLMAGAVA